MYKQSDVIIKYRAQNTSLLKMIKHTYLMMGQLMIAQVEHSLATHVIIHFGNIKKNEEKNEPFSDFFFHHSFHKVHMLIQLNFIYEITGFLNPGPN